MSKFKVLIKKEHSTNIFPHLKFLHLLLGLFGLLEFPIIYIFFLPFQPAKTCLIKVYVKYLNKRRCVFLLAHEFEVFRFLPCLYLSINLVPLDII